MEWAEECAGIIREHGVVSGSLVYDKHHRARWRARYLIQLLGELDIWQRWELQEHVHREKGGFVWTVEHVKEER